MFQRSRSNGLFWYANRLKLSIVVYNRPISDNEIREYSNYWDIYEFSKKTVEIWWHLNVVSMCKYYDINSYLKAIRRIPHIVTMHPWQCFCKGFRNKDNRKGDNDVIVSRTDEIHNDDSIPGPFISNRTRIYYFIGFYCYSITWILVKVRELPLNSGAIRNIVRHPTLENWPKHVSIKNSGMPHKNSIDRYGTRNAPTKTTQKAAVSVRSDVNQLPLIKLNHNPQLQQSTVSTGQFKYA